MKPICSEDYLLLVSRCDVTGVSIYGDAAPLRQSLVQDRQANLHR